MKEFEVRIVGDGKGLHARPASRITSIAKKYDCQITLAHGEKKANARSLVSILKLGVSEGTRLRVVFEGQDVDAAYSEMESFFLEEYRTGAETESISSSGNLSNTVTDSSILVGIPASSGVVAGPVYFLNHSSNRNSAGAQTANETVTDSDSSSPHTYDTIHPDSEIQKLNDALSKSRENLDSIRESVIEKLGENEAAIFEAHREMLSDPDLVTEVSQLIQNGQRAERAWSKVINQKAKELEESDDDYLSERAADIRDVGTRVLLLLTEGGSESGIRLPDEPCILIADELTPSDTALLDTAKVLGIGTVKGSPASHTAILARALGIPALVKLDDKVFETIEGTVVVLDCDNGSLHIDPDRSFVSKVIADREKILETQQLNLEAASSKAVTLDGVEITVSANISTPDEADKILDFGGEGIGLLRTELMFQNWDKVPGEDDQYTLYKQIIRSQNGNKVIIRTYDAGADKPLRFMSMSREVNPALGKRGVRTRHFYSEIFKTQVRAIARASKWGPVGIMFPMVSSFDEWVEIRKQVSDILHQLHCEHNANVAKTIGANEATIPASERASLNKEYGFGSLEIGLMIEVPSAALQSGAIALKSDFFSIGTNDLVQYLYAADRMDPELSGLVRGLDPVTMRLVGNVVLNAEKNGKWVSICGELASDAKAIPLLIGLGVKKLSVSVPAIPRVKALIRTLDFRKLRNLAEKACECESATEMISILS